MVGLRYPAYKKFARFDVPVACSIEVLATLGFIAMALALHGPKAIAPWLWSSIYFTMLTQLSHLQPDAQRDHATWLKQQISVDYRRDCRVTGFLTGHLNNQTLHHLFPGVYGGNLRRLVPLLDAWATRWGLPLLTRRGYLHALATWAAHLASLNQQRGELLGGHADGAHVLRAQRENL